MLMVVDADIRLDESQNPLFLELVEGVDLSPSRQGDPVIHAGIGSQNHGVPLIAFGESRQALDQVRTLTVIVNDHPTVLEIMDRKLPEDRLVVYPPPGHLAEVGT